MRKNLPRIKIEFNPKNRFSFNVVFLLSGLISVLGCRPQVSELPKKIQTPTINQQALNHLTSTPTPHIQNGPTKIDHLEEGQRSLYHLNYDDAKKNFELYIDANPKDPLGYFYKTALDWWRLAEDLEVSLPTIEKQFEEDANETIKVSRNSYRDAKTPKEKAVALLCEGGSLGLRGRWFVTRNQWGKAYSLGKEGNRLLKEALRLDPQLYDAYLGLGIYDYYTATLPGISGFFAKMLMNGNRQRGLEELKLTMQKGKYARVEAALFLIQINDSFEKHPQNALQLATQLREEFPNSPVMHMAEINSLCELKNWNQVIIEAQTFINKYSEIDRDAGLYFLGLGLFFGKKDTDASLNALNQILDPGNKSTQWATFAHLRKGQIFDETGNRKAAIMEYKIVLKRKDIWATHKEASKYLHRPFSLSQEPLTVS